MFRITNILNPLTGGSTTQDYTWEAGKPLSAYMGYEGPCLVMCGGREVEGPVTGIYPARKEEYTVVVVPEGGDNKTLQVLGMMAFTYALGGSPMFGLDSPLKSLLSKKWRAGIWLLGTTLATLFLRDKEKGQDTSQSYAWRHASSLTAADGGAMPVIYGKARVRPVIKNRYVTVDGDKQMLYVLYGLAAHKVDIMPLTSIPLWSIGTAARSIAYIANESVVRSPSSADEPGKTYICIKTHTVNPTIPPYYLYTNEKYWKPWHGDASFADSIIVDGRTINSYGDDVDWATRSGLPEQNMIMGFDTTYANIAQDRTLYLDYPYINTEEAAFEWPGYDFPYITWVEHTLMYHGIPYTVKPFEIYLTPDYLTKTAYLVFDPATFDRHYVLTKTPPSDVYVVCSFYVEATGITSIHYPGSEQYPANNDWIQPIATLTDTHNIEIVFEFPYGLCGFDAEGTIVTSTCMFFAQYRKWTAEDTESWINFDLEVLRETRGDYTRTDPDTSIKAGIIRRKKPEQFSILLRATTEENPLDNTATYQIRVAASSPSTVKLVNVATLAYGAEDADGVRRGFTYPGEPLLGIKALASGQISSDLDVQVDVERSLVWVYNTRYTTDRDGNASDGRWVQGDANNHAWAVYDILAQGHSDHPAYPTYGNDDAEAIYGCGIDKDRLDYESFRTWAENVGDIGYKLNIVFDTFMTAWDAILRICQEGRGMVYPIGTKIYAYTEKAEDVSQVFSMGNIHRDTFIQQYIGGRNAANMVEATYYDAENNYGKTTLAARTANWDSDTDYNTPVTVTLYGTTAYNQALSIAKFIVRSNELLNNTISFGVDVDALAVKMGEVVAVQHEVIDTGAGGRIVSAVYVPATGVMTLTLDRTLPNVVGVQYGLSIMQNDGTVENQNGITSGNIVGAVITFGSGWTWTKVPEGDEVYSFGLLNLHTLPYRVTEISRTNELMRTLTLVQYDGDMYTGYTPEDPDTGGVEDPPIGKAAVGPVADLLNLATNLRLQELLSRNRSTGEYESSIQALWDTVDGDPRGEWDVWYRDVDESDINWQGEWDAATTYQTGHKVEHGGRTYISIEEDNETEPFSRQGIYYE